MVTSLIQYLLMISSEDKNSNKKKLRNLIYVKFKFHFNLFSTLLDIIFNSST